MCPVHVHVSVLIVFLITGSMEEDTALPEGLRDWNKTEEEIKTEEKKKAEETKTSKEEEKAKENESTKEEEKAK